MEESIKERIVDKGWEKFLSMGFSKVTMDEIADELGVSKKTLYKYFPSKDALIEASIHRQILRIGGQVRQIVSADMDFVAKLHRLLSFMGNTITRLSKRFQDDLRRMKPELWQRIDQFRREQILANFSRLLEQGMQQGTLRGDLNKEIVVLTFLTALPGIINPDVLSRSSFSAEQAFENMMKVFFEGVLTDDARARYREKGIDQSIPPTDTIQGLPT